jgi:hypothetical protein
MDENEETMARLDMRVNEWQKSQEADELDPVLSAHAPTAHWRLGSPDPRTTSIRLETLHRGKPLYRNFNMHLREYLALSHPNYLVTDEENVNASGIQYSGRVYSHLLDFRLSRAKYSTSISNRKLIGTATAISCAVIQNFMDAPDMIQSSMKPTGTTSRWASWSSFSAAICPTRSL